MTATRERPSGAAHPGDDSPAPGRRVVPPASGHWLPAAASLVLVLAANALAVGPWRVAFIGPAIGFWFILVYPVYLCYTSSFWRGTSAGERAGYSVTAVLLLLLLAGLFANTALPWIGIHRPLDTVPVVVIGDVLDAGLFLLRRRFPAKVRWRPAMASVGRREARLLTASALCVPLVVLGANRLNNGAGDQLTLAALACMLVTFALLLRWQRWVREGVISVVVYLISLSLLLMTSLRGWSVTGHDIQGEYQVFQLTAAPGRWDISSFHNTYNACLSITILPTEISRVVNVYDPDVFKLFFQILFALCPVLVYAISRRHWSRLISILAVIYFVGFPTFFTDMPYENRQEIAFLFASVGILALTNYWWTTRQRRTGLVIAALGIELSHYSTMYIFLGILVVGWAATRLGARLPRKRRRRTAAHGRVAPGGVIGYTVNIGSIIAAVAILAAWGGLATGTAGTALSAIKSAVTLSGGARSGAVLYGVLHGSVPPPQVLLKQYRQQTLKQNAASGGFFVPAALAAHYPTPYVTLPSLPLTKAGRLLNSHGIPVRTVNDAVRQGAAKDEQLFIGVGLTAILAAAGLRRRMGAEFIALSIGSIVMLGLLTVLPELSVEYGVLRAFQEALIMIAPVLVVGSLTVFSLFREVWKVRAAIVVCLGFFFSTTGLMPQLLGGYPPQLNLNNSGQYYNNYYVHPQELAAVSWLANKPGVLPDGLEASVPGNRFNFLAPSDVTGSQVVVPAFPTLIEQKAWLLLDYATVRTQLATVDLDSNAVNYVFPMGLVENSKNLVYNNGGAEIFK